MKRLERLKRFGFIVPTNTNSLPENTDFSTVPGLGALFYESIFSNFSNVFSVIMFYFMCFYFCVCVSLLQSILLYSQVSLYLL